MLLRRGKLWLLEGVLVIFKESRSSGLIKGFFYGWSRWWFFLLSI